MRELLEQTILPGVSKPARYTGGELNENKKDWEKTEVKVCLSYPDTYEVGMSNLGLSILYSIVNNSDFALAERCYAPWPDMEKALRDGKIPIYSLESLTPLSEFDLIGFSLHHELTFTNMINILDLAGIPISSKERQKPIILAGGPCTVNPEPIADFVDLFYIGEGEEAIIDILRTYKENKTRNKEDLLKEFSKIAGVYVPALKKEQKIMKRIVKDLDSKTYPTKPIVPFIEVIHDRAMLEIMRGCPRSCKFCQARSIYQPLRIRKRETLEKQAEEMIKNTGYEELSLVSLSSCDYPKVDELGRKLATKFEKDRISISLPSVRMDSFSINMAKEIGRVRPPGVTLAPEAGTQRLRDLVGKGLSEEEILSGAAAAFEAGIQKIKLYFMIGLPTETEEDLKGIVDLTNKIAALAKGKKRTRITASVATFIPKPHTPFEREQQISIEETLSKQKFLKQNLRNKAIELRWHDAEASFLEGVFARGDRKLSKAVETAWKMGARLDAWSEHFKFDLWSSAFSESNIDPSSYLKKREGSEKLPWNFIEV